MHPIYKMQTKSSQVEAKRSYKKDIQKITKPYRDSFIYANLHTENIIYTYLPVDKPIYTYIHSTAFIYTQIHQDDFIYIYPYADISIYTHAYFNFIYTHIHFNDFIYTYLHVEKPIYLPYILFLCLHYIKPAFIYTQFYQYKFYTSQMYVKYTAALVNIQYICAYLY